LVWLILQTACSFMMISPKLHAIWPVFFLNLSQFNCDSFGVFWDPGRRLIIAGQE
jgi:hypothetical protein